jgi:hypothetical protein
MTSAPTTALTHRVVTCSTKTNAQPRSADQRGNRMLEPDGPLGATPTEDGTNLRRRDHPADSLLVQRGRDSIKD